MKLISKDRGKGKTTELIYISEYTGYPIVTHSQTKVRIIKEMAEKLECNIPTPICIQQLINNKVYKLYENVLIDETILVLQEILHSYFNVKAECGTISIEEIRKDKECEIK